MNKETFNIKLIDAMVESLCEDIRPDLQEELREVAGRAEAFVDLRKELSSWFISTAEELLCKDSRQRSQHDRVSAIILMDIVKHISSCAEVGLLLALFDHAFTLVAAMGEEKGANGFDEGCAKQRKQQAEKLIEILEDA